MMRDISENTLEMRDTQNMTIMVKRELTEILRPIYTMQGGEEEFVVSRESVSVQ